MSRGSDRSWTSSGSGSTSYSYPHPSWALGVVALGPQGPDPARGVLTFTSAPLSQDTEIAGNDLGLAALGFCAGMAPPHEVDHRAAKFRREAQKRP